MVDISTYCLSPDAAEKPASSLSQFGVIILIRAPRHIHPYDMASISSALTPRNLDQSGTVDLSYSSKPYRLIGRLADSTRRLISTDYTRPFPKGPSGSVKIQSTTWLPFGWSTNSSNNRFGEAYTTVVNGVCR